MPKYIDTTKRSPFCTLRNMQSWREKPMSEEFLNQFSEDLINWSYQDDAFCLTQFLRYYGVPENRFYEWVALYPQIKEAHWFAMTSLGDRREVGALTRKLDSGTAGHVMPAYSSTWAAVEERRAKLKRDSVGSSLEDLTNCVQALVQQKWGD